MARVFITGSTDGLGLAAARSLLADGHEVILHARTDRRADDLGVIRARVRGVVIGDLASAQDVRGIADQVNAIGRMDAVIHNAGLYSVPERGSTPEGHATLLAVNTLAPYMLTALIDRPDRLVYLSSGLHRGGGGSLDDLDWTTRPWDTARAYAESKLHLVALAFALARRWPDARSNAVDPGWVRTRMGGAGAPVDLDTGARTQSWLASGNDQATLTSGGYWHQQRRQEPAAQATDVRFQDALLARLVALTGSVWRRGCRSLTRGVRHRRELHDRSARRDTGSSRAPRCRRDDLPERGGTRSLPGGLARCDAVRPCGDRRAGSRRIGVAELEGKAVGDAVGTLQDRSVRRRVRPGPSRAGRPCAMARIWQGRSAF